MKSTVVKSAARVLAGFLILAAAVAKAQQLRAIRLDAPGFTVSDLEKSVDFYERVLHLRKVADQRAGSQRVLRMQLGDEQILLTQYATRGHPFPADSHANDQWFQHIAIVVSDMQKAYAELRRNHVRHASSAPQRLPDWNQNAAGIEAFYFRDPDGHYLELIHFPPGKGDPRWQQPSQKLFLGIDHTAVVVRDTDESLRFYRDLLGFRVAGESENYGSEQEHLNGVFGAHLRITSLRTESGPGIELLEYLFPSDGRPATDIQANDIAHWQTSVDVTESPAVTRKVLQALGGLTPASTRAGGGQHRELMVQDPDHHVLVLHSSAQ